MTIVDEKLKSLIEAEKLELYSIYRTEVQILEKEIMTLRAQNAKLSLLVKDIRTPAKANSLYSTSSQVSPSKINAYTSEDYFHEPLILIHSLNKTRKENIDSDSLLVHTVNKTTKDRIRDSIFIRKTIIPSKKKRERTRRC